MRDLLNGFKVLGIHPKYALETSGMKMLSVRDIMFCSLAKKNKLPILTYDSERYKNTGVQIFAIEELRSLK